MSKGGDDVAYSELIKNFEKIRDYMREFYIYGFKSRDDYTKKSARSYDDERRRIESWLGGYMAFRHTGEGKNVFISVDNRSVTFNPLHNAWKAKSFTDKDIVLHFCILDLLADGTARSVSELSDGVAAYLSHTDTPFEVDESTVRKKLKEYAQLGILRSEKAGKSLLYRITGNEVALSSWADATAYYSEEAPFGVIGSYLVAAIQGKVDFTPVAQASWIGLPLDMNRTVFGLFGNGNVDTALLLTAVITILPISFATMMEHIGDISAISSTVGRNFIQDPGLHRTLMGDGLATTVASLFGAPANTTYGENTGVLTLTKVYDPFVIRLAAGFAILMSFCPKFAMLIQVMPQATLGGISLVLYGMISAVGVRNVVETKVDFSKSRNVIIAALILVLSIGINYTEVGAIVIPAGGITISLSGLAVGSLVGILLNAILPGKDYRFASDQPNPTGVDLQIQQGETLTEQMERVEKSQRLARERAERQVERDREE